MNLFLVFPLLAFLIYNAEGHALDSHNTTLSKATVIGTPVNVTAMPVVGKPIVRRRRQLALGGQGAGLQSALQGISSGYGYGYNNAVGLGGLGSQQGYGLGIPMMGGFFG